MYYKMRILPVIFLFSMMTKAQDGKATQDGKADQNGKADQDGKAGQENDKH